MPRKQKEGRRSRVLTVDALGIEHLMAFSTSWRPGERVATGEPAPWESWRDYLNDWAGLRDDLRDTLPPSLPVERAFAEFVLERYGPNGPGPLDNLLIDYAGGHKPQPNYLLEYWSWRADKGVKTRD